MKRKNNSGQALLIILLIMAVALTVGLSVVSRSITDIRVSQQEEESARVFSAAEAGIEAALAGETITEFGDFSIEIASVELGGEGQTSFVFPKEIRAGDIQAVWLVSHDEDGNLQSDFGSFTDLTFYWGNEGTSSNQDTTPALEAMIIYVDGGRYRTRRVAFDPYGARPDGNDFTSDAVGSAGYSLEGKTFAFRVQFTQDNDIDSFPSGNLYAVRIKLLYNDDQSHLLGIETSGDNLPVQGTCYESRAEHSETGISRKVKQCQFHKSLPDIFDYVLFSEGGLVHQ